MWYVTNFSIQTSRNSTISIYVCMIIIYIYIIYVYTCVRKYLQYHVIRFIGAMFRRTNIFPLFFGLYPRSKPVDLLWAPLSLLAPRMGRVGWICLHRDLGWFQMIQPWLAGRWWVQKIGWFKRCLFFEMTDLGHFLAGDGNLGKSCNFGDNSWNNWFLMFELG